MVPCQKEAVSTGIVLGGISATGWRPRQVSWVVIMRIGRWSAWAKWGSIILLGVVEASIRMGRSSLWSGRSVMPLLPGGRSGLLAIGEYIWGGASIESDRRVMKRGSMQRRGCWFASSRSGVSGLSLTSWSSQSGRREKGCSIGWVMAGGPD